MAKKYLLYIHDDERFEAVENKSGLINKLLADHWQAIQFDKVRDKQALNRAGLPEKKVREVVDNTHYRSSTRLCKNGHIARDGKCTWKGCKYS